MMSRLIYYRVYVSLELKLDINPYGEILKQQFPFQSAKFKKFAKVILKN